MGGGGILFVRLLDKNKVTVTATSVEYEILVETNDGTEIVRLESQANKTCGAGFILIIERESVCVCVRERERERERERDKDRKRWNGERET